MEQLAIKIDRTCLRPYLICLQLPNGKWMAIASEETLLEAKHTKRMISTYFEVQDRFRRDPAVIYPDEIEGAGSDENVWK